MKKSTENIKLSYSNYIPFRWLVKRTPTTGIITGLAGGELNGKLLAVKK